VAELGPRGSGPGSRAREPDPEATLPPLRAEPRERPPEAVEPEPEEPPFLEVGSEFWAGPGTVAYELAGRFVSPEALATSLDPREPVTRIGDREWSLGDILVSVEYRQPGESVRWRVAGPPEVVEPYVARLRERAEARSPVTELGILPLEARHCCPDGDETGPEPG
jgi:hypothetical protein